ncbi:MAG TPA: hypothetical protein VGT03_16215 [Candidatus Acidoferrales bacterium]|nr:hypothetical protein [Candidatus Acidoferrales bacterium]
MHRRIHRQVALDFSGTIVRRSRNFIAQNYLFLSFFILLAAFSVFAPRASAQQFDPNLYSGMRWRQIGPFRAGRVSAVAGIAGNPAVYYMGTPGGGIWETTDGGVVWNPISDHQIDVASIGALEVAPSNSRILYAGTGDVSDVGGSVNQGDGMYKSSDGGKTWQHIGLEDTRHIGEIWIDPKNPDTVLVAALGHTYAPNEQRGVFKTMDGGKTWRKVLYKDDVTGAIDLAFAPDNPQIGFAALWHHYVKPDDPRAFLSATEGAGIYKTTDEGETWTPVVGHGLPTDKLGRIGVAVAPGGRRVFAIIAAQDAGGLYRSDDGGSNWMKITADPRVTGNGYFSKVYLDPHTPDTVYVMQTSMYRSTDGGQTFISYKGAPGGDDNHVLWIDPTNSDWMIMGSDQGATISLDGGKSWSSWYNQPTGQVYHLSTDMRWPYWVYGTQQDSGSIGTSSRGDYGKVTMLDWDPVGGYEFGYILPDPLDPNIIFAGGPGRSVVRIDRTNRQVRTVSANVSRDADYRTAVNPPLAFSPQDPHLLYEGTQFVLETKNDGVRWQVISPDLTERPAPPPGAQPPATPAPANPPAPNRNAINTLALSPVKAGVIWAGTTNGLIQLTEDGGKTWDNISPQNLTEWSMISLIDASPFDASTAYAAVDNHQTNDFAPHILRTHDLGKTWQEVDAGIPAGDFVRAVREDPARKGLLYAGTENGAFVSFDDGDHWQSLQLNLPTVSVRDLKIQDNDLVAATYGRAFWILDDLTPPRQISAEIPAADAHLFQPETAIRVRRDANQDTPFPPEMPAGDNPPTGAVIDYYLKSALASDITLAIYDSLGSLVRQFSSAPIPASTEPPPNVPDYWLARPEPLAKSPGMHRFVWDLRYPSPEALRHRYPISALYGDTPADPRGALVVPGKYEVRLTVNGQVFRQPLEVRLDPRVNTTQEDLEQEFQLDQKLVSATTASYQAHQIVEALRTALADREKKMANNDQATAALAAAKDFDSKTEAIEGQQGGRFFGLGKSKPTLSLLNGEFGGLATLVDSADAAPTSGMKIAFDDYCGDLSTVLGQWNSLVTQDLPALNAQLNSVHLDVLPATIAILNHTGCEK